MFKCFLKKKKKLLRITDLRNNITSNTVTPPVRVKPIEYKLDSLPRFASGCLENCLIAEARPFYVAASVSLRVLRPTPSLIGARKVSRSPDVYGPSAAAASHTRDLAGNVLTSAQALSFYSGVYFCLVVYVLCFG